jgi:hypothetical protein
MPTDAPDKARVIALPPLIVVAILALGLFAIYYNFVRIHKTLRTTPAMAAKVTKRLWEIGDIVDVLEAWENTT